MTPARRAIPRMSHAIPRHCVSPCIHIVGIATFADTVESSFNRIACETAPSASCLRSSPRTWIRWHARQRRPGAYLGVEVRVAGLTRIVSGSCASDTPGGAVAPTTQTTLPTTPRCRRLSPRWFATWAAPPRGTASLTASGGNCPIRGPVRDLPADDIAIKRGELHH